MGRAFEFRKERKFARWAKMSKTFTKIGREIAIAVKEGGAVPETNPKLRIAIQNAKSANMPKDTVDRAIQKASDKSSAAYKEIVYEGYGAHKICIVVETATDNPTRTVANVRSYFTKCNGTLATQGAFDFIFDRKCILKIEDIGQDLEELELELIDFGVEELMKDEDGILIIAAFNDYGSLAKGLEAMGIEVVSTEFERIPSQTKTLNEEEKEEVNKLLEKLEDDDDVTNVFHNMI